HLFSSGLHSNSGKSVTQRKSQSGAPEACPARTGRALPNESCISAIRRRNRPRTSQAISHLSAPKKMQSPSSIFSFDRSAAFSVSEKNFTRSEEHTSELQS